MPLTGKKNHFEWGFISPFTLQRTLTTGAAETVLDVEVSDIIDLSMSDRGNSNIIFAAARVNADPTAPLPSITALTVELWGLFMDGTTENWVKVAEDVNASGLTYGKLIRFENLPNGKYKLVVSTYTCASGDLRLMEAHTE